MWHSVLNHSVIVITFSLCRALKAALCFASATVPNTSPQTGFSIPSTVTVDWNLWRELVVTYCGLCSWSPWIFSQYSCSTFTGGFPLGNVRSNCCLKASCSRALFAASSSASFFLKWYALTKYTVCPHIVHSIVHWWVTWLDVRLQLNSLLGFSPLCWHHSLKIWR